MQVFNNVPAFTVWRNYSFNVANMRSSMSKLASGLKINNAGDDPAGLAMSERLRAQYRNTAAASSNVENKINYLLTADSWMQKIHDIMGRMAELAVMANDGTKSQTDRDNLQKEFQQMQMEVQRITSGATAAAKFNGLYLFRGGTGVAMTTNGSNTWGDYVEVGNVKLQVGPDSNQIFKEDEINLTCTNFTDIVGSFATYTYGSINMTITASSHAAVRWASLICREHLSISIQSSAQPAVDKMNLGIDFISTKRAIIGAELNRMQQTLSGLRSYEENIRASESRIRDVDVARETTEFSKYQILTQIGTAMLAQANAMPGLVMTLVG